GYFHQSAPPALWAKPAGIEGLICRASEWLSRRAEGRRSSGPEARVPGNARGARSVRARAPALPVADRLWAIAVYRVGNSGIHGRVGGVVRDRYLSSDGPGIARHISHSQSDRINPTVTGAVAVGPELSRLAICVDYHVVTRRIPFIAGDRSDHHVIQ